jgi:predicted flap endonuclease-1-like 5' DNA nuclease
MFQKWGFLLTEIWVLLALAALLGLFVGWLIWGRRTEMTIDTSEADRLRADLSACNAKGKDLAGRLAAAEARAADAEGRVAAATVGAASAAATAPAPLAATAAPLMSAQKAEQVAAVEPEKAASSGEKAKPKGLTAARDGKADDLKLIKGIGPALERLCHKLGFYHFDQLANWTASEIAWVDENLEGFKGRVTRDEWVVQARDLAAGKPPRAGGEK